MACVCCVSLQGLRGSQQVAGGRGSLVPVGSLMPVGSVVIPGRALVKLLLCFL